VWNIIFLWIHLKIHFFHILKTQLILLIHYIFFFLGLSYRNTAKALHRFIHRSHVSIWKWMQKYKPEKVSSQRKKINQFIIDETFLIIGSKFVWLWWAAKIEPKHRQILKTNISFERTMLIVAERFISSLINRYDKHRVSTADGGTWWYSSQACRFLKVIHCIHSILEKSLMERTMQYIKYRPERFDEYFPCKKNKRKLNHD
jgi:putative transposase